MMLAIRRALPPFVLAACLLGPAGRMAAALAGASAQVTAPEGSEEGKSEKKELFFKVINFVLLVGVLAYLLRRPAREYLDRRSASIRKSLEEGRKALEASQAQLSAVEEKLRYLDEEIRAFKDSAKQEMAAERERLRQAADAEARKILESTRAQMETAVRAAKIELKIFAAQQAVELAEGMVRARLDDERQKGMVNRFIEQLADGSRGSPGGQS